VLTVAAIGFGAGASSILPVGGQLLLSGLVSEAFSMPRSGVITSIAAYFSSTVGLSLLGSTVTITAQLYRSTTPDDVFTAIPGTAVTLSPSLTGNVLVGARAFGLLSGLNIAVSANTRLMLVFSASVTGGTPIAAAIAGIASAGVAIT
jgi:BclB C-terminal domain-containing protein